jgi:peptidoglycan/xylan/chitin deacetylase (PgdA/CDA1 family)
MNGSSRGISTVRKAAKSGVAVTVRSLGADRLLARWNGRRRLPLVICYHRVVEDLRGHSCSAPAMLVTRRMLERQLDWIGRRRRFVGLDELAEALEAGTPPAHPVAAVTFDDGYAGVYQHAMPLLLRKGIPAGVFVVTEHVGRWALLAHDEVYLLLGHALAQRGGGARLRQLLAALDLPPAAVPRSFRDGSSDDLVALAEQLLGTLPRGEIDRLVRALAAEVTLPSDVRGELRSMSWPMVAAMHAAGFTIGSHTRTHRVLPNETPADVRVELLASKRTLEERLGTEALHLAYPDGQYCPVTLKAARQAGYRYAYTTCFHRSAADPLLTIPRLIFWERSGAGVAADFSPAIAACEVAGVFDGLRPGRCSHGVRATGRPQPLAAGGDDGADRAALADLADLGQEAAAR